MHYSTFTPSMALSVRYDYVDNCGLKSTLQNTMKIIPISIRLLISLNLGLFILPVSAIEVSAKVIAFSCYGCHSSGGTSDKPSILKAKPANELEKKLLDFKYDRKSSTIMGRIAKGYTDTELNAVAQYLSQQK